jgi:hypothetical protein
MIVGEEIRVNKREDRNDGMLGCLCEFSGPGEREEISLR